MTFDKATILRAILDERDRQDAKWGVQDHADEKWLAILVEEVGEAARGILDHDPPNLDEEIIQIAAVCVAWTEARARRKVMYADS